MDATLLVIDDDADLLDVLAMALEDEGYTVLTAPNGLDGEVVYLNDKPDLVISDINMPKLDGFSLCRRIRERDPWIPIVLLTSRDSEIDEALGLELGADDYVFKPFSTRVLLARIRSLLRRQQARQEQGNSQLIEEESLVCGSLTLQMARLEVTYAQQPVTVTVTEFKLLEVFARRPGIVFSRGQLLDKIRGDGTFVAERIIDTYVRRLRRKFEAIDAGFDKIETVIGAGYRWKP